LADRNVKCWGVRIGWHGFGSVPIPVLGFANTIALSVGGSFACAVRIGGQVRCMGWNNSGDLGDGDIDTHATPVGVLGITSAVAVSAGAAHACALLADGAVMCWGSNQSGEVGTGSISMRVPAPVAVQDISGAIGVTAGADHTCALLANRTVRCWGGNTGGQLGNGNVSNRSLSPVPVAGLHDVSAISAGRGYTCAALKDGTAECWGSNFFGTLGNGTTRDSSTPVAVHGVTNAVGITAGSMHACVALADNSARCWGDNSYGKLGNHSQKASTLPVDVLGL
jgi:alpha-tubulin suppressor-like RCC1 family protein